MFIGFLTLVISTLKKEEITINKQGKLCEGVNSLSIGDKLIMGEL